MVEEKGFYKIITENTKPSTITKLYLVSTEGKGDLNDLIEKLKEFQEVEKDSTIFVREIYFTHFNHPKKEK